MLLPRIIPCLLLRDDGLVKTTQFKNAKYVGDPINTVRIFNEKEVDEIIILDIDATANNTDPNYHLIEKLAAECRMPMCYGGGIKNVEQAKKIFHLGVEKIALSSAALENTQLIRDLSEIFGQQSIVVILDVKKNILGKYEIYTHNGNKKSKKNLRSFIQEIQELGIGEIVINSINSDGKMEGLDYDLLNKILPEITCQLTIMGGVSSYEDIANLFSKYHHVSVAAGSIFVFKGKYRAVLISYPQQEVKKNLTGIKFLKK